MKTDDKIPFWATLIISSVYHANDMFVMSILWLVFAVVILCVSIFKV